MRGKILLAFGLGALLGGASVIAVWATSSHGPAVAPASPVVVGRVLLNGRGVPGAKVTLYAEANAAVLASLKVGDRIPVTRIGTAVSSGSGNYAISPGNWAGLRKAATNGIVNFYIQAQAMDGCRGSEPFFFSRDLVRTAKGPALAVGVTDSEAPQFTAQHVDLRLQPVRVTGKCAAGSR